MPDFIKDFFSWSNKERIGVIVLTIILLSLFFLNFFFDRWFTPESEPWNADSLAYYSRILDSLENDVTSEKFPYQPKHEAQKTIEKQKIKYYHFDPNKIGKQEWINFGFSDKQAQSILKFKKSINGFKTIDDLRRCYMIDSIKMNELKPYIQIDATTFQKEIFNDSFPIKSNPTSNSKINAIENIVLVELNKADSIQLLSIRGIGPYFSNKIIVYRKQLGGYYKKEQLLEIWNFDSSRYQMIYDQILIEPNSIVKLNINKEDIDGLKSHPYIRWSLANAIVKYRIQHGKYNAIDDVKNVVLMTDSIYKKLSPYLLVD